MKLTNKTDRKPIGYWARSKESATEEGLPWPGDWIDVSWSPVQRAAVVRYLQNRGDEGATYRGFSRCRLCGITNGSSERFDDVYVWPEGFAHYVEVHGVRPPKEFFDHVLWKAAREFGRHGEHSWHKDTEEE